MLWHGQFERIRHLLPGCSRYLCNQNSPNAVFNPIIKLVVFHFKLLFKMAYELTDANFQTDVLDSGKVTVVDLWAEWCQPCLAMGPIVDQLADEYKDRVLVGKLNVDNNQDVPMQYNVRGIPTFLIFKNGELKDKLVGTQPKKVLQDKIEALLA